MTESDISVLIISITILAISPICFFVKKNYIIGVRCKWSYYSDTTWRKSNRFGAVAFGLAGLFGLISLFAFPTPNNNLGIPFFISIGGILAATAATLIYAKHVYDIERAKDAETKFANIDGMPNECAITESHYLKTFAKAVLLLSILLAIGINAVQYIEDFMPLGEKIIATHFNAEGVADGRMKANMFYFTMLPVQLLFLATLLTPLLCIEIYKKIRKQETSAYIRLICGFGTFACLFFFAGINQSVIHFEINSSSRLFEHDTLTALYFGSAAIFFIGALGVFLFYAAKNIKALTQTYN